MRIVIEFRRLLISQTTLNGSVEESFKKFLGDFVSTENHCLQEVLRVLNDLDLESKFGTKTS